MDMEKLKQYSALGTEIRLLGESIEKCRKRLDDLPVFRGKVQASEKDFPYIRITASVPMSDPEETEHLEKLIRKKRKRIEEARRLRIEIEDFIAGIEDSIDRQIFEMVFVGGKTYREAGEALHMDFTTIAKRISRQLSTNSTK